jgi:hypothetical protein
MVQKVVTRRLAQGGLLFLMALIVCASQAGAQIAGQNVNMVSGTKWPGGDPFLQRQNEPSMAVSSRNPLHLLAGANDYRTVDLPGLPDGEETGDAWLGIFKSFDGGQTWQSTLLPGYPQDQSAQGLASPLKGYSAAADPVVRPGTNGLFYYSGIAFNRGSNLGAVFVSSFIDLNNKENGDATQGLDPIQYVGTAVVDTGTAGQFLDKPWVTADIPRAGSGQCTIAVSPTQTVPAGNVYFVWSRFTGSNSTKIMFTRSLDCGQTWSNPTKLSESNSLNQGTSIAVDPISGAVYVVWRRFATSSQTDAIVIAKSTDFGQTFTKSSDVATIVPFDQPDSATSFRTNSLPTIAVSVDSTNTSRVHVAWAARPAAGADARVYLTTSLDGSTWSNPAPVDDGPVMDDLGNGFTRGHQFMPQLTFAAGQLMVLYYDTRLDHTLGLFYPNNPFVPDSLGRFYLEQRALRGELLTNPSQVYTPFVDDAGLTLWRHTLDVRVAEATPSSSPAFTSAPVSQYRFGTRGDETGTIQYLQQLQVNPPNLPLFKQGTVPFIGDYIDIAGQTFRSPASSGGQWTYNSAPGRAPVFYATWTSNQDVRPPLDGDWTHYTPVGGGGQSLFDPTQTTPTCVSGQEGMRNQNIYSARITQGLQVTSPQNTKPLSTSLVRAFVVLVRNATDVDRNFKLTIGNQPPGGKASFLKYPQAGYPDPLTTLTLAVAAHSGVARSVFATSTNPAASITINVDEADSAGNLIPGGLSSFVTFNPDPSAPTLTNPDGSPSGSDISTIEIYNPNISNPNISNPNISNYNVTNPNISNPNISNPNISNPNISNPDLANPNISNPNISNPNISNPNISNPNISNPNISNQSISDATYTVTNTGNTSASYRVKLVGNAPSNVHLQLIVSKASQTPISVNCQLLQEQQNVVLANVDNPVFEEASNLTDPNIPDPRVSNATFSLRPGEQALITLRGTTDLATMQSITTQTAPVAIPHAAQTYAAPLFVTIASLPDATYGAAYSQALQAIGGTPPYSWSVSSGALPAGLSLSTGGQITGSPTSVGTSSFTIQVTDSAAQPSSNTKSLSLTVDQAGSSVAVTSSVNPSVFGQQVVFTAKVTAVAPATGTPTGTVTFKDGSTALGTVALAGGSVTLTTAGLTAGGHSITATYGGDSNFTGVTSAALGQTVNKAATTTSLTSSATQSAAGQSVTLTATVSAVAPGAGTPTVTFLDGATTLGSAQLSGGKAAFTTSALSSGSHSITASYGGDGNFLPSASGTVIETISYAFNGFLSPLTTAGTLASPSYSGSFKLGKAIPIKWQLTDSSGNYITSLSSTQLIQAVQNVGCPGVPGTQTVVLYSPTSGATGNSTFRYSTTNNQFIFNWDTSSTAGLGSGCYTLMLQLSDGSAAEATIVQLQ